MSSQDDPSYLDIKRCFSDEADFEDLFKVIRWLSPFVYTVAWHFLIFPNQAEYSEQEQSAINEDLMQEHLAGITLYLLETLRYWRPEEEIREFVQKRLYEKLKELEANSILNQSEG